MHRNGFDEHELAEYRSIMYKNVLESVPQVGIYTNEISLEYGEYSNRVRRNSFY